MRFAGLYLAAAMALFSASAWSQDASSAVPSDTADKPYATIIARNIFGLLPIPPPDTNPPAPPVDPPPKITLNGIMTIFGKNQALYKVVTKPKDGKPAKEDSHVLSEGEREDDIEVTKIDIDSHTVTFNNHGTIQDVVLTDVNSGGSGGGPGGGGGGPGGSMPSNLRPGSMSPADCAAMFRSPMRNAGGDAPQPATRPGYYNPNAAGYNNTASASGVNFNGGGGAANVANQSQNDASSLTPEQKVVLMEAQRLKYMQDGNPMAKLLPPTPLTPQNVPDNQQ